MGESAWGYIVRHFIFLEEDRNPHSTEMKRARHSAVVRDCNKAITFPSLTRFLGKRPMSKRGLRRYW